MLSIARDALDRVGLVKGKVLGDDTGADLGNVPSVASPEQLTDQDTPLVGVHSQFAFDLMSL